MTVGILIVVLSLAGLAIAVYFTLAYYGRVKKARWVPELLCAREDSSCVTVLQTPYARLFGAPNSLLGILYYLALMVWVLRGQRLNLLGFDSVAITFPGAFIGASGAAVALGCYLIYALRRKLRIHCPLCYAAHAINGALLILLIVIGMEG